MKSLLGLKSDIANKWYESFCCNVNSLIGDWDQKYGLLCEIANTQNGSRNANFSTRAVRIILIYITAIPLLTFHPFSASLHWQTSLKRTNVSRRNSFHLIERGFSSFSVLGLLDLARVVQIQGLPHQIDKSNSSILAYYLNVQMFCACACNY